MTQEQRVAAAVKPPAAAVKAAELPAGSAPSAPAARSGPSAADIARQVRTQRARRLMRMLALWVGLPTLAGILFYGFLARPEYESVATIVLTSSDSAADAQAVILREHMLSRDALAGLDHGVGFSEHYQQGGLFSGLPKHAGSESRFAFFLSHVDARYEPHGRVFTVRVRAFSGADAQRFATAWMDQGMKFLGSAVATAPQRFVVAARPSRPNEAEYPRRARGMLTVFLSSLALFGIGSLLIAAIREHAQF
jgi:capsule polysaccharide export protein KpsE/RkpR